MSEQEMAKAYDPASAESKWYTFWEENGYFHAEPNSDKEPYTVVIPPPNVTGQLHFGHVLNNSLQDLLIRFEKMRGKNTCWIPGTDHAGIATQAKVEAMLLETEGKSAKDLGRDEFLKRSWEWKQEYGGTIIDQLRKLGCSCDWERERFTLDPKISEAVIEVFVSLYEKGYIYKGKKMINWCPKLKSALSNAEVIMKTKEGKLWHINYPLADGSGHITVATTRPETLLGDTAVAVSENDERYKDLIGKTVIVPFVEREIKIIADEWVKEEFGTGAVKVTPAHDPNDYAIGQRHGLDIIDIMNDDASMNANAGAAYEGMDRYVCRKAILKDLEEAGLLVKIEDYTNEVGFSERGHVPVEPRLSNQWFCDMKELAKPAIEAVHSKKIKFHPERQIKNFDNWMLNIQDWCISRQLWWGHRIPAYYCDKTGEMIVSRERPERVGDSTGDDIRQEDDVLDTWFSSWLWPFSVHHWPDESTDLNYFYPTSTLVTGPDIIFFWVARMIMAGYEFMGDLPFKDVYYTALVRDGQGRKHSKSLGNYSDPRDTMKNYGTDALRYTLIYLAPSGNDIRYEDEKCEIGRNFATKIWNAARFRKMQGPISGNWQSLDDLDESLLRPDDRWILAECSQALSDINNYLNNFDFHNYALKLYEFIWNTYCSWYVESAKSAFYSDDASRKAATMRVFDNVFSQILQMMHPVMPFVTEEIYHAMGYADENSSIMTTSWPETLSEDDKSRLGINDEFLHLIKEKFELIGAGRNLRGEYNIATAKKIPYYIKPTSEAFSAVITADEDSLRVLLNAESLTVDSSYEPEGMVPSGTSAYGLIYMPLAGIIDIDAEKARLNKQKNDLDRVLGGIEKKLSNEKFLNGAPAAVIDAEKKRQSQYTAELEQVKQLLIELEQI